MKTERIDDERGAKLMQNWGLEHWPTNIDAEYRIWNEHVLFGLIRGTWKDSYVDLHMAVRPSYRGANLGTEAVADIIDDCRELGIAELRALITGPYTGVICKMATKQGFKYRRLFRGRQAGEMVDIIEMRLNLKANNRKGE